MFRDLEKNLGLRVKVLNDYTNDNAEGLHNPLTDLALFEKTMKSTFDTYQNEHRKVINEIRHREFTTFDKVKRANQRTYREDEVTPY